MQITHRAEADASAVISLVAEPVRALPALASGLDKAPRLSCCCRISELLPILRQAHDAARAARLAAEPQPGVAA